MWSEGRDDLRNELYGTTMEYLKHISTEEKAWTVIESVAVLLRATEYCRDVFGNTLHFYKQKLCCSYKDYRQSFGGISFIGTMIF